VRNSEGVLQYGGEGSKRGGDGGDGNAELGAGEGGGRGGG